MEPGECIREYYQALRNGDPLDPYFSDDATTVKFGISEELWGGDDIATGLREQTETTAEWVVRSRNLTIDEHGDTAWFADDVFLAWTDTEARIRYEFETRWSGTLVSRTDGWTFVGMHVSTAGEL